MKKLSDIIGLRIVTINDGLEIGIIRSVIINSAKGRIEYFATEKGISLLKAKIADARYVEGIGDYALTIKSKDDVLDINSVPEALELVYQGVELIGNRVISRKGKLLGEAVDLIIDEEDNCSVSSVQIISNTLEPKVYNIAANHIITYGQNFLVIDQESSIVLPQITKETMSILKNLENEGEQELLESKTTVEERLVFRKNVSSTKNVSDLFDFKQKQYLKGKTCTTGIVGSDGEIIVEVGQIIDETIYDLAKAKGKIFELIKSTA